MATPFRIKRSAVPGKAPAVSDLQLGELALNTYDGDLYTLRVRPGIGTEVIKVGGAAVKNVLHVNKNGDDSNTGQTISDAKLTIKGAVGIATVGTVIKVAAGTYIENNPILLPEQVSIVGSSLREVSVTPQNADKDLFHVTPGNYITELSYTGTMDAGSAIVAFDPDGVRYSDQSPYIRNCTNFIQNSTGMKIDGSKQVGPFKAMVTDSFTQYNQNGIGVSITNEGYAQIVSMFTICDDTAIYCGTGGACDVTNSNSSFGNYGLVAEDVGPKRFTGIVTAATVANADKVIFNVSTPALTINDATYDVKTGILTAFTSTPHNFYVGMGVTMQSLGFTCDYGNYTHTFVPGSSDNNSINVTGGSQLTPTAATYNPTTGDMVLTSNGHGLTAATSHTVGSASYAPATGVLTITITGHGFSNGDHIKFAKESLVFTCAKDGNATNHSYPRVSDPSYNKWLTISNVATNTFTVDVGIAKDTSAHTFVSATASGLKKAGSKITIDATSLAFTCSKDSNATTHKYPRTTDPSYGKTLGLEAVDTNTFTVNVGIATLDIFPSGKFGEVFQAKTVAPNTFVNTHANIVANKTTIVDKSWEAVLAAHPSHASAVSKCKRDIGYIVDAAALDTRDYSNENSIDATDKYFNLDGTLLSNGIEGEVAQAVVGFCSARDMMKELGGGTAAVNTHIDTVVGIVTTTLVAGNLNTTPLPAVSLASTEFSTYVGVSTGVDEADKIHYYAGGGLAETYVTRPFDGQVLYFDRLYYTVDKIVVGSAGTGYSTPPTITISEPEPAWGVKATATPSIIGTSVDEIEMISNGRAYTTEPIVTFSAPDSGINTATGTAKLIPTYYAVKSSTPISSGICTVTLNENIPYVVGVGTVSPFYKQSRILATSHSFEYVGAGTNIDNAMPSAGGVPIQENETDSRKGGLVVYTSTDQGGNFRIGEGVQVDQLTGTISGRFYSKSLFATMTPFILALGGD